MSFAHSTQTVAFVMAAIMAVAFVVARIGLERGKAEDTVLEAAPVAPQAA